MKIIKINIGLLIAYILLAILLVIVIAIFAYYCFIPEEPQPRLEGAKPYIVILSITLGIMIGLFLTFCMVAPLVRFFCKINFRNVCREKGCIYNYYLDDKSTLVAVDTRSRKMALLFKYNPTKTYVVSLDQVEAGNYNGVTAFSGGRTKEVYLSFLLYGEEIKVYAFRAGEPFSLDSYVVTEAISKVSVMVEAIRS